MTVARWSFWADFKVSSPPLKFWLLTRQSRPGWWGRLLSTERTQYTPNKGRRSNEASLCFKLTEKKWQMHLASSLPLRHTRCPLRQPLILLFLSQLSLPVCQAFPLPCGERARALPFHLFLSCSINLSVQPDAGRASCIPNTKNNHFSVTGVVVVGMVVPGRGAGMDGGGWWGGGKLLQLAGTRFNCSYSTQGGVMGKREGGENVFYIFVKTRNTQNVEYVPWRIRKAHFFCSCWGRTAQTIWLVSRWRWSYGGVLVAS